MRQSARGVASIIVLAALAVASGGCQNVSVLKVRRAPPIEESYGLSDFPIPSPGTTPLLREEVFRPGTIAALSGAPGAGRDPDLTLARAEWSYLAGRAEQPGSKSKAAALDFEAIVAASTFVFDPDAGGGDPRAEARLAEARAIYNAALARFLRVTGGSRIHLDDDWRADLAANGIRVGFRRDRFVWDPDSFDEFKFPNDYAIQGIDQRVVSEGVGVPLLAVRKLDLKELEERRGSDKFLMPRQVYAATAIMRIVRAPDGRPAAILELHDPWRFQRMRMADGRTLPLASDLSTPLAYHFARSALPFLQEVGLLDPQWLSKLSGLYMLHPYEPGKIPIVLVHGLRSSPAAWLKVVNDLQHDPTLRRRYQFWIYLYPTGNPFLLSAANLRHGLVEARQAIDPDRRDPALDRMVLVGHSMGGLITKLMIQWSGGGLWDLFAERPFSDLRATPEQRDLLQRVFFFEPVPSVRRVVFIATPHRGSKLGSDFIGRLTDFLIKLPDPIRQTYRSLLAQNGLGFFRPAVRDGLPSSIDDLTADNILLQTVEHLPIRTGVPYHSIIGQKRPGPIDAGSDGIVTYASAHLDGASSELVVPGDHMCLDTPRAIRELRRILLLHLEEVDLKSNGPIVPSGESLGPGVKGRGR